MTERLCGASEFLSLCPHRRVTVVGGVKSKNATVNSGRIGRCLADQFLLQPFNKSERQRAD